MKVAIIHDWLTVYGGAERALEQILHLFPRADLFSVIDYFPEHLRKHLLFKKAQTSFIQNLPFAKRLYRYYLHWMPLAIERLNVTGYDLVISSSSAVAKGVITAPDQLHICYCYSPMRYIWDLQYEYLEETGLTTGLKKIAGHFVQNKLHHLRQWDFCSAQSVDHFLCISEFVKKRIAKYYRREATVIYPPVDTNFYSYCESKDDYYVTASRLVPYKRIDLIVEAFQKMPEKKLIVIGDGPEYKKIKALCGNNVQLLGHKSNEELRFYLQKAKAFIYAATEDFGIVPLEAQACGTPVICFSKGALLETICGINDPKPTGLFFNEQSTEAICSAVLQFEKLKDQITPIACRSNALGFSIEHFRQNLKNFIEIKRRDSNESVDISRWQWDAALADVEANQTETIS